jgi:hypothetical protein
LKAFNTENRVSFYILLKIVICVCGQEGVLFRFCFCASREIVSVAKSYFSRLASKNTFRHNLEQNQYNVFRVWLTSKHLVLLANQNNLFCFFIWFFNCITIWTCKVINSMNEYAAKIAKTKRFKSILTTVY